MISLKYNKLNIISLFCTNKFLRITPLGQCTYELYKLNMKSVFKTKNIKSW